MTPLQLSKIISRRKLRRVDVAWLIGTSMRHLRYLLSGEKPIPQYVALLMTAYDEGLLTDDWLVKHITVDVPRTSADFD
jgi:hypothetical protein